MGDKIPKEAFTGVKPEMSHLRIFGCPMYIHVPKEKRRKMEPSGKKGTFVGYNEISKAFKDLCSWLEISMSLVRDISRSLEI